MATGGFAAENATGMAQNPVIAKLCADLERNVTGERTASPPWRAKELGSRKVIAKLGAELDQNVKGDRTPNTPAGVAKEPGSRNKDLNKTKLCVYYLQGKCGLGTSCQFAHSSSEIRKAPNLAKTGLCVNFMNGNCNFKNCTYAHGEAELVKPPSYKKKMCLWFTQGKCRNGSNCGFVHDLSELGPDGVMPEPWKSAGCALDCDASTAAPSSGSSQTGSSRSQTETDVTTMASKPIPDEHLFRMMAGRGSAPAQQQVKSMGLAIGDLQRKLIQMQGRQQASSNAIEGAGLQKQVDEMQHVINQLSKQHQEMELGMQPSSLRTNNQCWGPTVASVTAGHPNDSTEDHTVLRPIRKHRFNSGNKRYNLLQASTVATKGTFHSVIPPLAAKAQPAQSSYMKRSLPREMRVALGVLAVAVMVMVEVGLR